MGTYNSYFSKTLKFGEETPIWLGVVSPMAVGGNLASGFAKAGAFIPAGTPMKLASGVATPYVFFNVLGVSTSGSDTIITVKSNLGAVAPKTSDFLMKVGATFAATGTAWNPDSVAANATDAEAYDITVATASIVTVAEGDVLGYSSAVAEGSGKSLKDVPNCYLHKDVAIDPAYFAEMSNIAASCALVNAHGEGLLINRTVGAPLAAQLKAAIPTVILDERF